MLLSDSAPAGDADAMNDKTKTCRLWVAVFVLAVTTWLGCSPRRAAYFVPAEPALRNIHTLAVLKFDGPYGETLEKHIYDRLTVVSHFRPVRTPQGKDVGKVKYTQTDDHKFLSGLEALGVDAVIGGSVTATIHDVSGTDQVQVKEGTGFYKKEKDVLGQWVDVEIRRTVVKPVPYVVRTAFIRIEYELFHPKTQGIINTGKLTETEEEKFGGNKQYDFSGHRLSDLPSPDHLMNELFASLATKLVARISRGKLASADNLDQSQDSAVKRGVVLARRGAWKDAMMVWEQVIRDKPGNASAYYNLAVAYESLGDIESLRIAKLLYQKAASREDKKLYTEALTRLDGLVKSPN